MNAPVIACVHHYVCGEPDHGVAHGTCKRCGFERDFHDPEWGQPGGKWVSSAAMHEAKPSEPCCWCGKPMKRSQGLAVHQRHCKSRPQ